MTEHEPAGDGVRVRAHPSLCKGWGNCRRWAPNVYPLDDEGLIAIHLLDVPAEHALEAWRGASVCPEHAISVIGPPEEHWVAVRTHHGHHGREGGTPQPAITNG